MEKITYQISIVFSVVDVKDIEKSKDSMLLLNSNNDGTYALKNFSFSSIDNISKLTDNELICIASITEDKIELKFLSGVKIIEVAGKKVLGFE